MRIQYYIRRSFEVRREEGLPTLARKMAIFTGRSFKRQYNKLIKNIRESYADISIHVRWLVRYMLQSNFRYMVDNPVFIVGSGHCGSTLLLKVVSAHPSFYGLNETYTFMVDRVPVTRRLELLELRVARAGGKRWIDKTPMHVNKIEDILRKRPKAKILLVIRDGRDVALSLKKRYGDFNGAVQSWIETNKAGERWWEHEQVFIVHYESLIANLRETAASILSFLGEEFSELCCQHHLHHIDGEEHFESKPTDDLFGDGYVDLRWWQVQQPLYDGRNRWATEMSDEEKLLFKGMAGDMLIEYGYSQDNQW